MVSVLRWCVPRRVASAPRSTYEVTCRCDSPVAAICLGSPAIASQHSRRTASARPWRARSRGDSAVAATAASDRGSGDNRGGDARRSRRSAERRLARTTASSAPRRRNDDRGDERSATRCRAIANRAAIATAAGATTDRSSSRATVRTSTSTSDRVSRPRYYAPAHYDRWARQLLPLESDRLCAVVADLRLDRVFEFRLLRRVSDRIRLWYYGYGYGNGYGPAPYSPWQVVRLRHRRHSPADPAARRASVRRRLLRGAGR